MRKIKIATFSLLVILSLLLGACGSTNDNTPTSQATLPSGEILGTDEISTQVKEYWKTTTKVVEFWSVTPKDLNAELAGSAPFLVDVRFASEIQDTGYISGAINIPIRQLLENLDKLPGPVIPIVLYDATGHRSALGTMVLRMIGYTNVRSLTRGVGGWKSAGLPLVTGSLPAEPLLLSAGIIPNETVFPTLDYFMDNLPEGAFTIKPSDLAVELTGGSSPFLVDLRLDFEWEQQHISGATRIEFSTLLNSLDQLPTDKNAAIVVYCSDGHRSAMAVEALTLLGYGNVRTLAGGIYAWKAAGLPVE